MGEYTKNIGYRVIKHHPSDGKLSQNKFKSGLYVNTVKGVINHPQLNMPAYTFEEDETYVECRRCKLMSDIIYSDLPIKHQEHLQRISASEGIPIITAVQGIDNLTSEQKKMFELIYYNQSKVIMIEIPENNGKA